MKRKLDEQNKDYFKQDGTVAKWWEPESDRKMRKIFAQEIEDVVRLIEPKDKTILDCGTGKGRFAIAFAKEGAKW